MSRPSPLSLLSLPLAVLGCEYDRPEGRLSFFEQLRASTREFRGPEWHDPRSCYEDERGCDDDLERVWIESFSSASFTAETYALRLSRYVPVLVNWHGLQRKPAREELYRAWKKVFNFGRALAQQKCVTTLVILSITDMGPLALRPDQSLAQLPNLLILGGSHGHIPIPMVRRTTLQRRPCKITHHILRLGSIFKANNPRYVIARALYDRFGSADDVRFLNSELDAPETTTQLTTHTTARYNDKYWTWPNELPDDPTCPWKSGWKRAAAQSRFCITSAAWGRNPYSLSEVIQIGGCVPVYVWDDLPWLAYVGEANFSRLGISLRMSQAVALRHLAYFPEASRRALLRHGRRIRHAYTLPGVFDAIGALLAGAPRNRTWLRDPRLPKMRGMRTVFEKWNGTRDRTAKSVTVPWPLRCEKSSQRLFSTPLRREDFCQRMGLN